MTISSSRRRIVSAAGGAGLLALYAPPTRSAPNPRRGGVLTMTTPVEPTRLQPALDTNTSVQVIGAKMHNGLLNYGPDFSPKPELATKWAVAPDGLSIRFDLRPGVKWHDGQPFTSADVKFTMEEVIKKLHSRGRGVFASLIAVETPDPLTAVFRLSKPAPYIMSVLYASETPIVPKHVYEGGNIANHPANGAPIGTGPFKFKEWRRGSHIVLERNPDYFEPQRPYLDRIVFRIIRDASARSLAFESKEVDLGDFWPVSIPDMKRLGQLPYLGLSNEGYKTWASMDYFEFNLRDPLFQDVRVRRAMAHAIDRDLISRNVYMGLTRAANGHISEAMERFFSADKTSYKFDPELAMRLLDEAGRPKRPDGTRFEFTLEPTPSNERHIQTGEYLAQAFRAIGIKVNVRHQDIGSWLRRVYTTREAQAYNYGIANMMDPTVGVQRQYWSRSIQDGVPYSNGSGYRSARVDQIFESAMVEPSEDKRKALFAELQRILMDELPNIPLTMATGVSVYNRRVHGFADGLTGVCDTFAGVWVDA